MKLVYQYMIIFFYFKTTSSHLHPLQVENCESNSRRVVNEYDNGKFRIERVNVGPPSAMLAQHLTLLGKCPTFAVIRILIANHDKNRFKPVLLADQITVINENVCLNT